MEVEEVMLSSNYQSQHLKSRGVVADFKDRLITNALESLGNRFPADPIIDATSNMSFCKWPSPDSSKEEIRGSNLQNSPHNPYLDP